MKTKLTAIRGSPSVGTFAQPAKTALHIIGAHPIDTGQTIVVTTT